jgi:hypothetical protein
MLVDVGNELFIARVMRHVRLPTFHNTLALLLPVIDILDPSGIVFNDRVIGNRRRVVIFGGLEGKIGPLLSPVIMAG